MAAAGTSPLHGGAAAALVAVDQPQPGALGAGATGFEAATLDATVSGLPGDVRAEQISFWRDNIADGLIADGIRPEDAEREASLVKATFTGLVLDLLATGHRKRLTDALECALSRLDDLRQRPREGLEADRSPDGASPRWRKHHGHGHVRSRPARPSAIERNSGSV